MEPGTESEGSRAYSPTLLTGARLYGRGNTPARTAALQQVQQTHGNRAARRMIARRAAGPGATAASPAVDSVVQAEGHPLDGAVRGVMESRFGQDFSNVRVHTDPHAAASARGMNALAYTVGQDIAFDQGQYAPDTPRGQRLIAHELAHVVQQGGEPVVQNKLEVSEDGDAYEQEADAAADIVLASGRPQLQAAPGRIRRFKQGNDERPGGHAWMTSQTLQHTMGLSQEEAHQGRLGNWERDLSQAITPGTVAILNEEGVFGLLNIMAIKEFGRGLDPAEFGTYDPVEHMDNPTDLRGSDVFQQGDFAPDRNVTPGNPDAAGSGLQTAGPENVGYATVDPRYAGTQTQGAVMNPQDAHAFQVDESGIPVYMNTSREWLKRSLRGAAGWGRHGGDGRGPRDFTSGIHVMQDYYAHSNFVEIALNILIRSGGLHVANDAGQLVGVGTDTVLDTHLHANDAAGNPVAENLAFNGREVMTTGSFNLTDTAASLLEELKDKVVEYDPFKEKTKGPSPLASACLDYIDMQSPTDFSGTGRELAELIHPVARTIAGMGSAGGAVVEGAGSVAGDVASGAGSIGAGALRGLSRLNGLLGGDSDYFEGEARSVEGAGHEAASAVTGAASATAEGIRSVTGALEEFATGLEHRQHILRDLYAWVSGIDMLAPIKAAARAIPVIGEAVAELIETLQQQLREKAEELLSGAWRATLMYFIGKMDRAIARIREHTNIAGKKNLGREEPNLWDPSTWMSGIDRKLGGVGDLYDAQGQPQNGIAPGSYTPPSHTEIAKDHADVGGENHEPGAADSEAEELSAWLNPIAEALAQSATVGIGAKVATAWDKVDAGLAVSTGDLDSIDQEVDVWFRHPAECRTLWERLVTGMLGSGQVGPELLRHLAARRAQSPATLPATSGGPSTAPAINAGDQGTDH